MSVLCIIQARMGSTRFPGKVLAMLGEHPVIWHVYTRCREAIPRTVVAIPASAQNDPLADYLKTIDAPVFRWDGPEEDVLGRYVACLNVHPADWVVRVTGDCPLIEPALISQILAVPALPTSLYACNSAPTRRVPSGFDVEVVHSCWLRIANLALAPDDPRREHVTQGIRDMLWHTSNEDGFWPHLSIDTPDDLERVRALIANR